MKTDINRQLMQHVGQWVAVTLDYSEIIAAGDSIAEVENKLEAMKYDLDIVVITYITPPDKFLSPNAYTNI